MSGDDNIDTRAEHGPERDTKTAGSGTLELDNLASVSGPSTAAGTSRAGRTGVTGRQDWQGRSVAELSAPDYPPPAYTARGPAFNDPIGDGLGGMRYTAGPTTEAGTARTSGEPDSSEVGGTTTSDTTQATSGGGVPTCAERLKEVARRGVTASMNAAESVVNLAGCVCCCTLSKRQRIGYAVVCAFCGLATVLILDDKGVI